MKTADHLNARGRKEDNMSSIALLAQKAEGVVRDHVMNLLSDESVSIEAIEYLIGCGQKGLIDGTKEERSFFATLGKGMGLSSDEMRRRLHEDTKDNECSVEVFCSFIESGSKPSTNLFLQRLILWSTVAFILKQSGGGRGILKARRLSHCLVLY